MTWIISLLAWLICGLFAHGFVFAYVQHEAPQAAEADKWPRFRFTLILGLCGGPFALLAALEYAKHGLRFLP